MNKKGKDFSKVFLDVVDRAVEEKASDIHFVANNPPILRIERKLVRLNDFGLLKEEDVEQIVEDILDPDRREKLKESKEVDFSLVIGKIARFRVNVFYTMGKLSVAMRLIPRKILTIDELNLPPVLHKFTSASQGFLLVVGPSSHGKSTTLAALIDEINHSREVHIITIEDPIEYIFEDDKSVIEQREVGFDTNSFASALRASFRQDPDVIMVGEMRDLETISTAITAAETGHLVFSTLHTNDAAQTIHRIVNTFPSFQQPQIRAQLAGSLLGIVSQRLVPRIGGGLIPACEILINTPAVANLIRENKIHEIPLVMETSRDEGMITLNRSLAQLVERREITVQTAMEYSPNMKELQRLIGSFF